MPPPSPSTEDLPTVVEHANSDMALARMSGNKPWRYTERNYGQQTTVHALNVETLSLNFKLDRECQGCLPITPQETVGSGEMELEQYMQSG